MTDVVHDVVRGLARRRWADRVRSIEPLEHGITNSNYVIDLGDERFVVRLPGQNSELLGIDRTNERRCGDLAAAVGVGPEVIDIDAATGCMVFRFIDGRAVPADELAREPMLGRFVSSLRLVHGAGPVAATFDPFTIIRGYRDLAERRSVRAPFDPDDAMTTLARIESVRPFRATVLGHNDLLNANFLYDGRLRIVDWEYAGMGDPFFDLANVAVNNDFDRRAETALLGHYFGEVTDELVNTLSLMKIVSELREAWWGVVQLAISSLDVDFADYAGRRGRHAAALWADLEHDEVLASAAALTARGR